MFLMLTKMYTVYSAITGIHFNSVLFYKDSPAMLLLYHWNLTPPCVCMMSALVFFTMLEMSSLNPLVRSKFTVTLLAVIEL